jgi:hypothetical protein
MKALMDELPELVEEYLSIQTPDIPEILAAKLLEYLKTEHPDVLSEWLHEHAQDFLTRRFSQRLRALAAEPRVDHGPRSSPFAEFSSIVTASGRLDGLDTFTAVFEVNSDGEKRTVAEMTEADHLFVSAGYQRSGTIDAMLAAFHRVIGRAVGKNTTAEVMTEEQYRRQFNQLVRDRLDG